MKEETNKKTKEKKAVTKKPRAKKKETKKTEEKHVPRFGDFFNLHELVRVKGKDGLYVQRSPVTKSGMVGLHKFPQFKDNCVKHVRDLQVLGEFMIKKLDGTSIPLSEAMSNLNDYENTLGEDVVVTSMMLKPDPSKLLEKIVPGYDPDKFKDYHVKQILKWYNYLKYAYEYVQNIGSKTPKEDDKIKVNTQEN